MTVSQRAMRDEFRSGIKGIPDRPLRSPKKRGGRGREEAFVEACRRHIRTKSSERACHVSILRHLLRTSVQKKARPPLHFTNASRASQAARYKADGKTTRLEVAYRWPRPCEQL
jgi:hypothetical protein